MNYIETMRANLASTNKVLRDGTLKNSVNDSVIPVEITNDLMELCLMNEDLREDVLLNCETFPKDERTIELLLQWAGQLDEKTKKFVQLFLENTPASIIAANEKALKEYVSKNTLDFAKKLDTFEGATSEATKPLWKEYKKLLTQLAQAEKMTLFKKAAQIQDVLIQNGEFNEAIIQQILKEELRRVKLTAKGILAIRAIGVLKLTDYIPQLTPLLSRQNEEVLLSVVVDALIKMNSDAVVEAVEPFILNERLFYDAISILKEIRTPLSEQVLLNALKTNPALEIQENLIAALTSQLSTAFLPFVDEYLPTIEASELPDYEEMLYLYYQSLNETHPKLEQWYKVAKETNELQHAEIANTSFSDAIREEEGKVGRNDPCVCGSGKKFKKCCGKE